MFFYDDCFENHYWIEDRSLLDVLVTLVVVLILIS